MNDDVKAAVNNLFQMYSIFDINTLPMTSIKMSAEKMVANFGADKVAKALPITPKNGIEYAIKMIINQTIKEG